MTQVGDPMTNSNLVLHPNVKKGFRLVALECPYDILHHEPVQTLFSKVIALKIKGYLHEHPYGVLPVDSSDFIGDHLVLCKVDENENWIPIMAQKSLSLRRARLHSVAFPFSALADSHSAFPRHREFFQNWVTQLSSRLGHADHEITYESAVTIDPELRVNPPLRQWVRDLIWVQNARFHQGRGTKSSLTLAATQFKMHEAFNAIGYQSAADRWGGLADLELPAGDDKANLRLMVRSGDFPPTLAPLIEANAELWEDRLILNFAHLGSAQERLTHQVKKDAPKKAA